MNKFEISIVALDRSTAVIRKINNEMSKVFRPVTNAQRQFVALGREMHIDKIARGFVGATKASAALARNMGVLTGPLESMFGIGLAGGVVGGIVATGAAIVGLGARWGAMGFEINRTSKTIGVSADDLQRYRAMARLAGIDSDTMTQAMSNLGGMLHNTLWNGDPAVQTVLDRLQMSVKKTPEGIVDTAGALIDLSRAISRVKDPHTQMNIARVFGVEGLLPVLRQGPEAMAKLLAETKKFNVVAEGPALDAADRWTNGMNRLKLSIDGVANSLGQGILSKFFAGVDSTNASMGKGDFLGTILGANAAIWSVLGGAVKAPFDLLSSGGTPASRQSKGVVTDAPGGGAADKLAFLAKLEAQKGLPAGILKGVWGTESSFGRNTGPSSAGAQGDFQFMPGTAAQYGVKIGDFESEATGAAAYLSDLYTQRGSWKDALYGYNGVKTNVDKGEKYVRDVAANSATQTLRVELAISGAPLGMRATAKASDGAFVPTRINYSMPLEGTP